MRYIHWRDDFSITESFSTAQGSSPVPQRVRIEYFTARGRSRFVAERNGNTFVNCELSGGGTTLTVHISLRDKPIGHGRLLRIATVITEDPHFPGGLKYSSYPGKLEAILYFGKSDGPLDLASEIVFDGVDRLSLLQDVDLSNPDEGDLLSWNGSRWTNIPQSAIRQDLSGYVTWGDMADYVTQEDLQDVLSLLDPTDELSSLSSRISALEDAQFFELDGNGGVKLKDVYAGLWARGWGAFGGIGTGGSDGGGGLIQTVYTVSDLGTIGFESVTETFSAYAIDTIYKGAGAALSLTSISQTGYLKDSLGNYLLDSNGNRLALPGSSSSITRLNLLNGDGIVLSSVDLDIDIDLSAYVPKTRKINGHALTSDVTLSATADLGVASWAVGSGGSTIPFNIFPVMYVAQTRVSDTPANGTLLGVDAISHNSISGDDDASRIEWEPDAGGVGVGAWHVKGNLYVDGWFAALGIGTSNGGSGGGGGGGTSSVMFLDDLNDVTAPNPRTNDILVWSGNGWANTPKSSFLNGYLLPSQLRTINGTSLVGVGDITIHDGKSAYEIWLEEGFSGTPADFLASLQGDSGYQGAAGELQVVNNYTEGGATAALSAEMGKQLYAIITALDASGYKIAGIATPTTNPSTPAYKVAYLAGAGTYPYFGDLSVGYNELSLLIYSSGNWLKVSTSIKVSKQVDDLLYRIAKTNFYDPNDTDMVDGYYLDVNGDLVENANYLVTGYIPFTASMGKMVPSVAGNDMSGAGGFLVLYDSDKQVVASYQENEVDGIATWEDGVSYVRFSIMGPQRGAIQIEVGDVITTYMPFGSVFIADDVTINGGSIADGTVLGEKIAAGSVSPEKCTFFKSNLFNPDDEDVAEGYYLDNGGNLQENPAWLATGYIPFASGKMCASVDGTDASGGGYIVLYDRNKTRVASYQSSLSHNVATWEDNVAYVRFSLFDYTRGKIQVEPGDTPTDYVAYGKPVLAPEYSATSPMVDSILGEDASRVVSASLADGGTVSITNFPYHIKKGLCMSASADITSFNTIYIGKGYQQYRGDWLKIDGTHIVLQHYESSVSDVSSVAHGLTISTFLRVSMSSDASGALHVVLNTLGGVFQCVFDNFGFEANYAPFLRSAGSSLTNVVLTAGNMDFRCPVWACGDSYFGVYEGRWPGWMKEFGYFNLLINGLAGQSSPGAYNDLKRMLSFGTPKYLIWCLGMNDTDANFVENFDKVKALCSQKGITMIGATVPTVPSRNKESISAYVRASGIRYIDFYKAVGTNSSGNWYYGYLDSDGVHPSIAGAKALATQVLVDFPELMQYGLTS
jgi:hypothetical protein